MYRPAIPHMEIQRRQCAAALQWRTRAHFRGQMWWLALLLNASLTRLTQLPRGRRPNAELLLRPLDHLERLAQLAARDRGQCLRIDQVVGRLSRRDQRGMVLEAH